MTPPRLVLAGIVLVMLPAVGTAQTEPPGFVLWSAEELEQRNGALAQRIRPDGSARETLADYGNPSGAHRFRFIRRDADGVPEQHAPRGRVNAGLSEHAGDATENFTLSGC